VSEQPLRISPRFVALSGLAFWVVIAGILVVAFNYDADLPKVAGYSGANVLAAAIMVAIWIGVGIYLVIKRKPRA
jgi:hypothetical protein